MDLLQEKMLDLQGIVRLPRRECELLSNGRRGVIYWRKRGQHP